MRLCQQYFLVSAAVANIISEHFAMGEVLERLPRRLAIHINDTHPALVIPELMRVLMDTYSYPWETAWALVHETVSYTNHTVLPEALETWRVDLFRLRLPRIYAIIEEINRRLTKELWQRHVGDWERVSRMAIIAYGQVRMAGLSVVASSHINGVSRLHTEILKKTVFSDYYAEYPTRFCSVTNGVTHRRWLLEANPALTALLDATIGNGYHKSPEELAGFAAYSEDAAVLARLSEIKKENKRRFSRFLTARGILPFSEEAILDVHVKRLHEYKRQLLGALKVLSLYEEWQEDPHAERQPMVFLFGGKAAKSYYMAKEILRLLLAISRELSASPLHDALRLEFVEEYNVSVAEALIPAADISEQISLAGKEASGTGCMKLMMNGALTLGTRDGANIEIVAAAGEENAYLFGLREHEVEELWKSGYDARAFYRASPRLMAVIDRLYHPIGKENFSHIADYLVAGGTVIADPYMCLADFDAYFSAFTRAVQDYRTPSLFERKSLYNIAASGYFSSDRSVREYAEGIWHLRGVRLE